MPAVLLTFTMSRIASGQTYTISTTAGGALPVNIPGTSASLYGGPAINSQLNLPQGAAVDSVGNLYIADLENNRIRKVSGGASFPCLTPA